MREFLMYVFAHRLSPWEVSQLAAHDDLFIPALALHLGRHTLPWVDGEVIARVP